MPHELSLSVANHKSSPFKEVSAEVWASPWPSHASDGERILTVEYFQQIALIPYFKSCFVIRSGIKHHTGFAKKVGIKRSIL